MSNPQPFIRIERFRAPHGPEEDYTPEEIWESMQNSGADLLDMMVQKPELYWPLAEINAAEIVARDRERQNARLEQQRREEFGRTLLGRLMHKLF